MYMGLGMSSRISNVDHLFMSFRWMQLVIDIVDFPQKLMSWG